MRLALSLLVLLITVGAAGALAAWGMQRAPGESDAFPVEVIGPDGPILAMSVEVQNATVLRALQVAAEADGIPLTLERYPGMGTYVRAIGGIEARGPSGWIYEVQRGGAWTSGDRSAELYPLQKGDATRWSWTAG